MLLGWANESAKLYVEVMERHNYVVKGQPDSGIHSPPAPVSIVEGCKYDFSVVAAIVGIKFGFHNPMYRQQDWFAQSGWFPSRSTCNDLIQYAVDVSLPLYQQMWSLLLSCPILYGDDTRIRLLSRNALTPEQLAQLEQRKKSRGPSGKDPPLDSGPPGSLTSYAWYYGAVDAAAPYDIFHWSLTHQHSVIDTHLADYQGIFVGDADGANARLEFRSGGRIRHASCNTHARRRFVKAESHEPLLASQASEQRIRPLAIGRNNWLFLGHPAAAPGRLQLFSLVSSAHRHHLVLQDYLEDVLSKLAEAQQRHPTALEPGCPYLLDLLPDRWAAAHPQSVRQERIAEQQRVSDAKRLRWVRARIAARQASVAGQSPC